MMASTYEEQYGFQASPIEKKVAFFLVDVETSRKTFAQFGIETVPRLFSLPPTAGPNAVDLKGIQMLKHEVSFQEDSDPLRLISAHIPVELRKQMQAGLVLTLLASIALILASVSTVSKGQFSDAFLCYRSKLLWSLITLFCFAVGVSGSIYCIIKSSSAYGYGRDGQITLFMGQGREQYVLEGLVVSLYTLGLGFGTIALYYSSKREFGHSFFGLPLRSLICCCSLALCVLCGSLLFEAYCVKTQWYNFFETLPAELKHWMRAELRKSSGLVKRLYRAATLYLSEYKNWKTFLKKLKIIFVGYLPAATSS